MGARHTGMTIPQNPNKDSRSKQSRPRSNTRHARTWVGAIVRSAATVPMNFRREIRNSEPRCDKAIDGRRRVPEQLVGREAVAGFHLSDEPAIVTDLIQRRSDRRPVVVAQ